MRRDLLEAAHCLWCGASIVSSKSAYYCSDEHSELRAQSAARATAAAIGRCPTPRKRTTRYRGTALRWAVISQMCPYRCQCGSFYLTSNPKSAKPLEKPLAQLADDLHQPWPPGKVSSSEYKEVPGAAAGSGDGPGVAAVILSAAGCLGHVDPYLRYLGNRCCWASRFVM